MSDTHWSHFMYTYGGDPEILHDLNSREGNFIYLMSSFLSLRLRFMNSSSTLHLCSCEMSGYL